MINDDSQVLLNNRPTRWNPEHSVA